MAAKSIYFLTLFSHEIASQIYDFQQQIFSSEKKQKYREIITKLVLVKKKNEI
jgi:hypothetical protein